MKPKESYEYLKSESEWRRRQEDFDDRFKAIVLIVLFIVFFVSLCVC